MTQRNQKQTTFVPRGSPHALNDLIEQRPRQQQLIQQLQRSNARLGVLEVVNSRLGSKLLEFQLQLGVSPQQITKQLEALDQFPLESLVDPNILPYLESLFTAYDDSNLKQKKLIGRLYSQLNDLQKRTEIIVRDNAFLMQELENKCKVILQIYDNGFPQQHLAGIYLKLQKQDLELKQSTLMDENQYLNYTFRNMESKYFQTNKQLESTRFQLEEYFESFKSQAEKLKQSEIGATELQSKLDYLIKEFRKSTDENATLQARCVEFEQKIVSMNNQLTLMRKQLQNTKRGSRESEDTLKEQINTLQEKYDEISNKQRSQFNQIITFEKQVQIQKDNAKKFKRENEQNKKNLEDTLKMIETYELKVTHLMKKNEALEKQIRGERQESQSAILQRDKAILRQQQLQKQIEVQISRNKQDLQTLKESYQKIIKTQGQRSSSIEQSLEQSEIDKQSLESTMKSLSERHRRQLGQMREETERLSKQLRLTNCEQLINKAREGEDKAESLKRVLEHNQKSHRDDMEDKMDIIRRLEAQNRQTTRLIDKQRILVKELTSQRNTLKNNNSKLTKELNVLTDELDSKRRGLDAKMVVLQSEQQNKVREVEQRLNERLIKEKDARQRAVQKLEAYQELEKQLKKEFQARVRQLENQNQTLKQKLLAKRK